MVYITYEEPLVGRMFDETQMGEVYRDMADKAEYPDFECWKTDMLKSGVFEQLTQAKWEIIVSYMDDSIRENIHQELAPCTETEFLSRYLDLDPSFSEILKSEFNIDMKGGN